MPKKITISYEEGKELVNANNIKTLREYNDWDKRKSLGLPSIPASTYRNSGWLGAKYFFGTLKPSLQEVRGILENNNIRNHTGYINWDKKKEFHLPSNLGFAYKEEGFINIPELLGVEGERCFSKQRVWIHKNTDLKSSMEFNKWVTKGNRPSFISSRPDRKFKGLGWSGWDDFLDTGVEDNNIQNSTRQDEKYSYEEFKLVMLVSKFYGSPSEYVGWRKSDGKKYSGLPIQPSIYYKEEWLGWEEVGVYSRTKSYYSLEDLINLLSKYRITNTSDYKKFQKTDKLIPSNPLLKYPELKNSYMRLFGKPSPVFEYLSYEKAKECVRSNFIMCASEYFDYINKKHTDALANKYPFLLESDYFKEMEKKVLPSNPHLVYKDFGWQGWEEFTGVFMNGSSLSELRVKCELDSIFGQSVKYKNSEKGITEIDIFYPDINLGIEYNGSYWHKDRQERDKDKFEKSANLGITLIHILESSSQHSLDIINKDLDVRTVKINPSHLDLLETIQLLVLNLMVSYIEISDEIIERMVNYLSVDEYQANDDFKYLLGCGIN